MAKKLSGLSGGKRKKGKRKGGSYKGWKVVSKKACTGRKGRLKKGCKWGRGKYRGKVFKKVG
jgi:hypothetical protein